MNVLLIHQYFLEEDDAGGSRWNEILKVWIDKGVNVTVISGMVHANGSKKRDEYKKKLFVLKKQGKITVWRCHVSEAYNKNFLGRLWGYFSFMFSSFWAGFFKIKGSFDIVIATSPPLFIGLSAFLISRYKKLPLLFEIRDLWPESAIDTGILKSKIIISLSFWFEKFIYKKSKLINVLTPAFYKKLVENKKVSKEKIIIIPNAADFSLSDELLKKFDSQKFRVKHDLEKYFVITYVGAHGVANDLDQILDACKMLSDTTVLFLLIGQGMEKKRLINRANEMGLKNIRFINSVPKNEVFKYILASDMGVSVLKNVETFKTVYSNKTFDYMSCKKPVIMAIDGVSRELIQEAGAGSYVQPGNINEYDSIIRDYIANPSKGIKQGENGYNYAKINFDRNLLAQKYLKYIQKII